MSILLGTSVVFYSSRSIQSAVWIMCALTSSIKERSDNTNYLPSTREPKVSQTLNLIVKRQVSPNMQKKIREDTFAGVASDNQ